MIWISGASVPILRRGSLILNAPACVRMYDCVSHKFNVGTQRVVSLTKQENHGQSILLDESGENEEVSENKDTIQTERDHIIMLLKR